jgi:catechol 2,3-dioxygenase-like lactoylglutathione lyase family enzyme
MLDHITLPVTGVPTSRAFYEAALAPLGFGLVGDYGDTVGFGTEAEPAFWIAARPVAPVHVAFRAVDRAAVDAFHEAALAAGATDNGGPGVREQYSPSYYAAFVLDPDGHNVEAVCHTPV